MTIDREAILGSFESYSLEISKILSSGGYDDVGNLMRAYETALDKFAFVAAMAGMLKLYCLRKKGG